MTVWKGICDGEAWGLEVQADCMAESEPFTVSVWVTVQDPALPPLGAFLSADRAREVAAALLVEADAVDANNRRVA